MQPAQKVALNTSILYIRILITMFISLYSTRLVLNSLGSVDYGIYNLTAGLIAMLSFLSAAMSTSTQRNLSFHQSEKNLFALKKIFANSLILHIVIGLVIVFALEVGGIFFFDKVLKIPTNRIDITREIFHYMSLTFFITFVTIPFSGSLIAHENMMWIAFVSIIEVLLKLGLALSLNMITGDKLQFYAIITSLISIVSGFLYISYCLNKYDECTLKLKKYQDGLIIKQIASFTGWNLFGSLSSIGKTQGIAVLLNIFFGPVINTAYALANQIASQLNFFSATMLSALNPQIMKSEGLGDRSRMLRLSLVASKFGFLLLAFIAIPCIFEMKSILRFWLKDVPDYSINFCSLILVAVMLNQLTVGLDSAIQATGNIKKYMLIVGSVKLLILPVSYIILKMNFPTDGVLLMYALTEGVAGVFRLFILKKEASLEIILYFKNVILRLIPTVFLTCLIDYIIITNFDGNFRFFYTIPSSIIIFFITAYLTGLDRNEKETIEKILNSLLNRIGKKYIKWQLNDK